ncbi:MAG: Beta-phosphoglucomutase, HAD superfamily [Chloroflexi bacterium]|jgi:HAD superfamily hydrolase (TIGR01509 family)|nr:MAG: Beta-phosphoglucomutase, HAD superfamily [Chloroflexota bacterium]
MTPDLVIFDCDGVLVDSEIISNSVLSESLETVGLDIPPDVCIDLFLGKSWDYCFSVIKKRLGTDPPHNFHETYMEKLFVQFEKNLKPVEDIHFALENIPYPKCVASSGPHLKISKTLSVTGLLERFGEHVYSGDDVKSGKPAPDLFLHAAVKMSATPSNTLVIEDSTAGVEAAYSAGMTPLAFCSKKTNPAFGQSKTIVFRSMRELPDLINRL